MPGEPIARHPVTPEPISDLAAVQRGDAVVLSFTLPKESADHEPLERTPSVEVYRSTSNRVPAASVVPTPKPAPPRLEETISSSDLAMYAKNGHVEFPTPLNAANLASAPGQEMSYVVRTRVSSKRASADSNSASLPVYPPPPQVGNLHGSVTESAILLTWTPATPDAESPVTGYRIYRSEVPAPTHPSARSSQATALPSPLQLLGDSPQPEYRDTSAQLDHAYSYLVRSIARFGSATVESADSTPLTVFAKDNFPPAEPQALEAVVVPETNGMPAYVELAWGISPEADFAGYIVYRGEQNDTPGQRLNPELLSAPTFRDITVASGRHYFYRVAAVDRDGNISALSSSVEADIP